ncbi:MAG: polysaccharide biosynthesis tyrosine autokinase [Acidimicrobiales bacterium]
MMYQANTQTTDAARLEDYIQAVSHRKWLVLALALLGLLGAFVFASGRAESYTATATVIVNPTPVGGDAGRFKDVNLDRERQILESTETAEVAIVSLEEVATTPELQALLGLPSTADDILKDLDVSFQPQSEALEVAYTSPNAERSRVTANAFATAYVGTREGEAVSYYQAIFDSNNAQIEATNASIDETQTLLAQARQDRVAAARDAADSTAAQERLTELDSLIAVYQADIANLNIRIRTAENNIATAEQQDATRPEAAVLSRRAVQPAAPDGIGTTLTLFGGLALGLLAGVVGAFLLERLDTTARDEEDVALALGTTVMGSIPTLGIGHRSGASSLVMLSAGGSSRIAAAREAFRRLRSSLQFLNTSSGVSSLIVTSSAPAEGKSLTSANLSIALAQNGSRVVLVSADLRRPSLERLFGMEASRPGLSEYLSNTAELNAEKVPGIENLWLIRAGRPPSNPGELLNSDRFEQMVKELEREDVEYIVVDTPPVLSTADAMSAARYVDGVIVVVDTERTETSDLLQVRADLERSGSKLLGAVMNRQKFDRGGLFRRGKYAYYRADSRRASGV